MMLAGMVDSRHEVPAASLEEEIFENIDDVRGERPGGGSPSDIAAAILNGGNDSTRISTALLLRTMAGDKVKLKVSAFFASAGDSTMNVQASSSQMLSALLGTLGGAGSVGGSGEGGGSTGLPGNLLTEGNYTGIYDAIKESVTNHAFPRAYLNWIAFDGNMRLVASQSGALQVGAGSTDAWESLEPGELTMAKSGYLVVYLSNEAYMDVAFDQLSVTHYRGKLLQEQHYYPHGLVIDGVTAPGAQPTREKYQGKEVQDELGLELYDFHARQYDPQLGRFWGIDRMDQFPGGYTGMGNDPANMVDPDGMQAGVSSNSFAPVEQAYSNGEGIAGAYESGNQLDEWLNSGASVGGNDRKVTGEEGAEGDDGGGSGKARKLKKRDFRRYDKSVDVEDYNCAGLAFRNYEEMNPDEFLQFLEDNSKKGEAEKGDVRFYMWEYYNSVEEVNGAIVNVPERDFHIVAGLVGKDGSDPKSVYSKDGLRPVQGPGAPFSFTPPGVQKATYSDRYATPGTDNAGRPLKRIHTNLTFKTYVIPFSVLQTFKFVPRKN